MSWVQWNDEVWPSTNDEGDLDLWLWLPDASCPRQNWRLALSHREMEWSEEHKNVVARRFVNIEISDLHFFERDWRLFSDLEIRADWKWHQEDYLNEYGKLEAGEISVDVVDNRGKQMEMERWIGHEFTLKLGRRDGFCFPCELEGWLIPEEEYYRKEPEPRAEVERFSESPPNLRMIAPVYFTGGRVMMPRCGDDPLPQALKYLKEMTGCEEMHGPTVQWDNIYLPGCNPRAMPGWGSTISFATR
jgi:hypothetical protein